MNKHKISAIIITLNEEDRIRDCLESLKWVDEIIVVDSYSTDNTIKICKEYTNNIYTKAFNGFGEQKQYACSLAKYDWILSIDADEILSVQLSNKIKSILQKNHTVDGYYLHRKFIFLGKVLNFTFRKEYVLRLFRKGKANFNNHKVHESVECKGTTSKIKEIMYHESYRNISHMIEKENSYSQLYASNRKIERFVMTQALIKSTYRFICHYFLYLGFLDGRRGYIMSIALAHGDYIKYLKCFYNYKSFK